MHHCKVCSYFDCYWLRVHVAECCIYTLNVAQIFQQFLFVPVILKPFTKHQWGEVLSNPNESLFIFSLKL